MGSTRRRRKSLITMSCITPERLRARIRTKVVLRHTMEAPLLGPPGIDLHLGKNPKLGGRYTDIIRLSTHHILSGFCISIFCFLLLFLFHFYFLKHKKTKNISVVSLHSPFSL